MAQTSSNGLSSGLQTVSILPLLIVIMGIGILVEYTGSRLLAGY